MPTRHLRRSASATHQCALRCLCCVLTLALLGACEPADAPPAPDGAAETRPTPAAAGPAKQSAADATPTLDGLARTLAAEASERPAGDAVMLQLALFEGAFLAAYELQGRADGTGLARTLLTDAGDAFLASLPAAVPERGTLRSAHRELVTLLASADTGLETRMARASAYSRLDALLGTSRKAWVAERLQRCVDPVRLTRYLLERLQQLNAAATTDGAVTNRALWQLGHGIYRSSMRLLGESWDRCDELQRAAIQSQLFEVRRIEKLWRDAAAADPTLIEAALSRLERLVFVLGDLDDTSALRRRGGPAPPPR